MDIFKSMLELRRPAGSTTEREFINRFIKPLGCLPDNYGNYHLRIGDAPVIWSSHTDTVHAKAGRMIVNEKDGILSVGDKSNCLGADDCAGVWLMTQMIEKGIEGYYIFHREEEGGGCGSAWISSDPEYRKYIEDEGFKAIIALDRMGYADIITHQSFDRCCSDDFALSLAEQLGGDFKPSQRGSFTDSANYTGIIGECTNLSIGYFKQHSYLETQDFNFLTFLLDKLCTLDFNKLVYSRKAGEIDTASSEINPFRSLTIMGDAIDLTPVDEADLYKMEGLIINDPEGVADLLSELGYNYFDLADELDFMEQSY